MSLATIAAALTSACSRVVFTIANLPTAFGPVERRADIAYGEEARQRLDVYTPPPVETGAGPTLRPVVVFWYGGSFTDGRKEDYRFVGHALATRGFVAVLPDYRLYPAVRFPDLLQDPARAVAWVQRHAADLGGDPRRVVLMGHSAGAYIASYLALERETLEAAGASPDAVRGLVGLSGPYALDPNSDVLNAIFGPPYEHADWQPVRYVSAGDPPTLLLHGLDDGIVSASHARELRRLLEQAGVRVEAHLYADRGHADTVAAFAWAARGRLPALERTTAFIEDVTAEPSRRQTVDGLTTRARNAAKR